MNVIVFENIVDIRVNGSKNVKAKYTLSPHSLGVALVVRVG